MAEPAADPDRFDAAVDAFRKRVPMVKEDWDQLTEVQRERAFTVSRVTEGRVLQDTFDAIDRAVEEGLDLEDFKDAVAADLIEAWGGEIPGRLENLFRTNILSAYAEGRHEIMSSPTVKQARPYWRFDDAETDRECEICSECGGPILPADDPWWDDHTPLLHFQALPASTPIWTAQGQKRIADIVIGEMVLTHRRRWRPVTAVMHKLSEKRVLELQLGSGGVLRITEEHPVLISSSAGKMYWKRACDLEIGDNLVKFGGQLPWIESAHVTDPKNAPSLGDQPDIAAEIAGSSGLAPVTLAIHLYRHSLGDEGKIENVGTDGVLSDCPPGEHREQVSLRWGQFLSVGHGFCRCGLRSDLTREHRVTFPHSSGDARKLSAPCPMVLPAALRNDLGKSQCELDLLETRASGDPIPSTPIGKHPLGNPMFPLQISQASLALPVFNFNEFSDDVSVVDVDCHDVRIIAIREKMYNGELCDLEIFEDNSYVASTIVVHNCQCKITPLAADEVEDEDIEDDPDSLPDADEGFGAEPSSEGTNWDFDLSGMDPELRAAVEDALRDR